MTIYVSSAYLNVKFPSVTVKRSAALIPYDAGPTADPCIVLADISSCSGVNSLTVSYCILIQLSTGFIHCDSLLIFYNYCYSDSCSSRSIHVLYVQFVVTMQYTFHRPTQSTTLWYDTIREKSLTWTQKLLSDQLNIAHLARKKYQKQEIKAKKQQQSFRCFITTSKKMINKSNRLFHSKANSFRNLKKTIIRNVLKLLLKHGSRSLVVVVCHRQRRNVSRSALLQTITVGPSKRKFLCDARLTWLI